MRRIRPVSLLLALVMVAVGGAEAGAAPPLPSPPAPPTDFVPGPAPNPGPGNPARPDLGPGTVVGPDLGASRAAGPNLEASQATGPDRGPWPGPFPRPADRTVALTFDDGPSPYTPAVLAVLRRDGVRATFCMLGDQARRYPATARQVVLDGHQLCNHSRDHRDMARLSPAGARREVVGAEREIHDAAGVAPTMFRFPYGSSDARARRVVDGYGMGTLGWDVDPRDWSRPAASAITTRIVGHVRPGSIVLLHDGGGDRSHTVAALDATIRQLRRRGYRFVEARPEISS